MSDYHIRLATVGDFDGVMDIGDVYMGADYLRHRYHSFMDDRNVRSYVYIIGKQIVGFCSVHLIDDGLTFLVRAGRVKEGFRGKGVYSRLLKHVHAEHKDVDSIKYDVITTRNYNFEAWKKSLENTYMYTVSSRKTILSYQLETEDIERPGPTKTSYLEEVTSSTMTSLLEDEKIRDTLFPEGKMIINWVPLRLFTSNMKYIMTPDTFALQSISDNFNVSLLTVGTSTECKLGLLYNIDVFANDVTGLCHHIIRHFEHLKALTQKQIVLQIVTSSDFCKTADDIMKNLRISSFHKNLRTEIISLEKGFK
ncbi:histidine N-acetyltransferase-like [Haliotis rubra]|uniref:histidine N-acetyltransferase-like n=1 Tax=Haliotis rubra TaxID=36100 RepID=UPI001EE4FACE|nr:histidine N-acetyltransferase-like [Haliotis rubra]